MAESNRSSNGQCANLLAIIESELESDPEDSTQELPAAQNRGTSTKVQMSMGEKNISKVTKYWPRFDSDTDSASEHSVDFSDDDGTGFQLVYVQKGALKKAEEEHKELKKVRRELMQVKLSLEEAEDEKEESSNRISHLKNILAHQITARQDEEDKVKEASDELMKSKEKTNELEKEVEKLKQELEQLKEQQPDQNVETQEVPLACDWCHQIGHVDLWCPCVQCFHCYEYGHMSSVCHMQGWPVQDPQDDVFWPNGSGGDNNN